MRATTMQAVAAIGLALPGVGTAAHAQSPPGRATAGRIPLDRALAAIAADRSVQLIVDPVLVANRWLEHQPPPGLSARDAIAWALGGTGAIAREAAPGVFVVEKGDAGANALPPPERDIIVTALRRPTLLGRTPATVRVVSSANLADRDIHDTATLGRQLPELTQIGTSSLQRRLALRGVAGTGESTVGTYFGETPISGPSGTGFDASASAPDIDLVDVERIELLKGPQGTLYGAGSMGGTLRTLFNRADPAHTAANVSAQGSLTAHGDPGGAASAMVNLPIARDTLAIRAVASRRHDGGSIDNDRLALHDTDARRRESERVSLAWLPDATMRLDLLWLDQRNRIDDASTAQLDDGRLTANRAVRVPSREALQLGSATLRWSPTPFRVVATASHYNWNITRQIDFTRVIDAQRGSTAACLRYAAAIGSPGCDDETRAAYVGYVDARLPAVLYQPMRVASTIAEVRVSDPGGGSLEWTAGVFMEHRRDRANSYTVRADAITGSLIEPLDITGLRVMHTSLDQQAVYGEVRHAITDTLSGTIGGRLYRYVRYAGGSTPVPNIITGTGALSPGDYRTSATGGNLKLDVAWQPSSGLLLYALAAQGYRPGGVNITPELTQQERVYRADRLWSIELGAKASQLPHGLGLEASLYRIDWSDTIFSASSANGAFTYNANLTSVLIHGAEAQVSWAGRASRVTLSGTLTDARLSADTMLGTSDGIGFRGDRLPNIPLLTYSLLWDHALTAGGSATAIVAGGGLVGNSGSDTTFNAGNAYREHTPAHVVADLFVTAVRGAWTARLRVTNLFDALAPGRIVSSSFGLRQAYVAAPRTVTLGVSHQF